MTVSPWVADVCLLSGGANGLVIRLTSCETGREDVVRIDGIIPRRAKGFSLQLGFDKPNIVGE